MKQLIIIGVLFFSFKAIYGQEINDSIYNSWWRNKGKSIFQSIAHGDFQGTANGYIQLVNGNDTTVLDFQSCKATLKVIHDPNEMYDRSTKEYLTRTTSGKTALKYEVYALANILVIVLNNLEYSIGVIDGASDMPVSGLSFNYCPDGNSEFLTLYATKVLELKTTRSLMRKKNITWQEAVKMEKIITMLPGSTIIFMMKK